MLTNKFILFSGTTPSPPPRQPPISIVPPPGVAPSNVPQPGQPGGGDPPRANPTAAALAPPGTVPVAVFPPYTTPRTYPANCVIFSELQDSEKRKNYGRKKRGLLNFNFPWKKYNDFRSRKGSYEPKSKTVQRKFGFRCKIRLVEERCQLDVTCDRSGNKINPGSNPLSGNQDNESYQPVDNVLRRQTGEQFSSDSRPDCRATLASDGCT